MSEPRGYSPEGEPWYDDGTTFGPRWALWNYETQEWDPLPRTYDPDAEVKRLRKVEERFVVLTDLLAAVGRVEDAGVADHPAVIAAIEQADAALRESPENGEGEG